VTYGGNSLGRIEVQGFACGKQWLDVKRWAVPGCVGLREGIKGVVVRSTWWAR
jgi:hypothetical protein